MESCRRGTDNTRTNDSDYVAALSDERLVALYEPDVVPGSEDHVLIDKVAFVKWPTPGCEKSTRCVAAAAGPAMAIEKNNTEMMARTLFMRSPYMFTVWGRRRREMHKTRNGRGAAD